MFQLVIPTSLISLVSELSAHTPHRDKCEAQTRKARNKQTARKYEYAEDESE